MAHPSLYIHYTSSRDASEMVADFARGRGKRIAENEPSRHMVIPRRFAIAAREVTLEQFQRFLKLANNSIDRHQLSPGFSSSGSWRCMRQGVGDQRPVGGDGAGHRRRKLQLKYVLVVIAARSSPQLTPVLPLGCERAGGMTVRELGQATAVNTMAALVAEMGNFRCRRTTARCMPGGPHATPLRHARRDRTGCCAQ
jgi:hypothetical protein